jgi:predicted component of type VI protein secretion system
MIKKTLFEKIHHSEPLSDSRQSVARVIEHILRSRRLIDGDKDALPALPDAVEHLVSDSDALQHYSKLLRALILRHEPRVKAVEVKSLQMGYQQRCCELELTLFDQVIQRQFSF